MEYERSLFVPDADNWPDLRPPDAGEAADSHSGRYMTAWCHGAPGIGLARLDGLQQDDDLRVRREIDAALRTTQARGLDNHSLCHGDLGNIELLLRASRVYGDSHLEATLQRRTAAICRSIATHGPICGNPMAVESPGQMTGLSGIGYQLLRLADPTRVPAVLTLAPPL
jgi:lantibiotic modifying enzyme